MKPFRVINGHISQRLRQAIVRDGGEVVEIGGVDATKADGIDQALHVFTDRVAEYLLNSAATFPPLLVLCRSPLPVRLGGADLLEKARNLNENGAMVNIQFRLLSPSSLRGLA